MDETMFRMVSEMLLLSLLMFRTTASVMVNEQCNGAQEHDQKERWRSGGPLWAESGTSSLEEAKEVTPLGSLKRDLLHLCSKYISVLSKVVIKINRTPRYWHLKIKKMAYEVSGL